MGSNAADMQQVLDHYVSGFDWTIPTRTELLGAGSELPVLAYSDAKPQPRVHAGPGLLESFLKLETASDEAILAYARRWGPLWLCEAHNLPFRHHPDCEPAHDFEPIDEPEQTSMDQNNLPYAEFQQLNPEQQRALYDPRPNWYDEALAGWRELSRQMRATVRIARRLHDGRTEASTDWDAIPVLPALLRTVIAPALQDPLSGIGDYPSLEDLAQRWGVTYEQVVTAVPRGHYRRAPG